MMLWLQMEIGAHDGALAGGGRLALKCPSAKEGAGNKGLKCPACHARVNYEGSQKPGHMHRIYVGPGGRFEFPGDKIYCGP
jgi:hypothetical protein